MSRNTLLTSTAGLLSKACIIDSTVCISCIIDSTCTILELPGRKPDWEGVKSLLSLK